jgi:hypothetical protein
MAGSTANQYSAIPHRVYPPAGGGGIYTEYNPSAEGGVMHDPTLLIRHREGQHKENSQ